MPHLLRIVCQYLIANLYLVALQAQQMHRDNHEYLHAEASAGLYFWEPNERALSTKRILTHFKVGNEEPVHLLGPICTSNKTYTSSATQAPDQNHIEETSKASQTDAQMTTVIVAKSCDASTLTPVCALNRFDTIEPPSSIT